MGIDIREKLGVDIQSPFWQEALEEAEALPRVPVWLTEDYLLELEAEFDLLGDHKEAILRGRAQVVADPELLALAKVLWCVIGRKKSYKASFTEFSLPEPPQGEAPEGYDFVSLLPVLGHVAPFREELARRGIGKTVFYDTLSFLRGFIGSCGKDKQRPRFEALHYLGVFVYTDFLWFGRLRFEIQKNAQRAAWVLRNGQGQLRCLMWNVQLTASGHIAGTVGCENEEVFDADFRETEEFYEGYAADPVTGLATVRVRLPKDEWVPVLRPGDDLLKVHIPYRGRLDARACAESYEQGRKAFREGFPEYDFKGFVCTTWLLDPVLGQFLKPESNIVQFGKDYTLFPAKSAGADTLLYVYKQQVASATEVDVAALPEDNSMMRGVKRLMERGEFVLEFTGFMEF